MGLLRIIKIIREERKRIDAYKLMSADELLALDDEELYEAISERVLWEDRKSADMEESLKNLSGGKLLFYIVWYLEMEVNNGGLCQYFVNSSSLTAPYILDALRKIKAEKHYLLLKNFVDDNQIDLADLELFKIEDAEDFGEQFTRYPFEEFDQAYYELEGEETIELLLAEYVRENIQEFLICG